MKRACTFVVLCLLAGLGSCGGGGGGGEGEEIPIDQLAMHSLAAGCGHSVACGYYPDVAACDDSIYFKDQLVADVHAGKIIYDGRAAARCLGVYQDLGCTAGAIDRLSSVNDDCESAFKGTLARGAACFDSEECLSGNCVKTSCAEATCCVGSCADKVAAGGDCSASGARCATGLVCRWPSGANGLTTATCVAPLAKGQPCTNVDVCASGTTCVTDPVSQTKSCASLPTTGASCPDGLCDDQHDTCDGVTKTCVPRLPIGRPCVGRNDCVMYARCDSVTMTCVARGRAGEACSTLDDCMVGLRCTASLCVSPPDVPACP